jgi:hypothetical protein
VPDTVENVEPIETQNDFALHAGQNLPNHSTSLAGRGRYVRQSFQEVPIFRDRESAYRYAAWLITMAEVHLPSGIKRDEPITFDEVLNAIRNT